MNYIFITIHRRSFHLRLASINRLGNAFRYLRYSSVYSVVRDGEWSTVVQRRSYSESNNNIISDKLSQQRLVRYDLLQSCAGSFDFAIRGRLSTMPREIFRSERLFSAPPSSVFAIFPGFFVRKPRLSGRLAVR